MIKFYVGTETIEDSNLFLRKLWSELHKIRKNGWNYCPYRKGNRITIGYNNLGEVSFDYEKRGTIKNFYIDADDPDGKIVCALETSKSSFRDCETYDIRTILESKDRTLFAPFESRNLKIQTIGGKNAITFTVKAFSLLDVQHTFGNLNMIIRYFLCVYTHSLFDTLSTVKACIRTQEPEIINYETPDYSYDWYDTDECPRDSEGRVILPGEAVELINQIIENDTYEKNLQLLINAAQQFYWCSYMMKDIHRDPWQNQPGYIDIVNSILVSTLEPLASIGQADAERCPSCNNLKYSISKKIRALTDRYLPEYISRDIGTRLYGNRSKFFHEGIPMTYEHYAGSCMPLIDTRCENQMWNYARVEYNNKDYIAHVFRRLAADYLAGNLAQTEAKESDCNTPPT